MTKVTWFFRGSGRLGGLQFSTVPLMLSRWLDARISDPDEPPVSRTMFSEESGKRNVINLNIVSSHHLGIRDHFHP